MCLIAVFLVTLHVTKAEFDHSGILDNPVHPLPQFSHYSTFKPQFYHGRLRREISSSNDDTEGGHISDLTIALNVEGNHYLLDLQQNRNLITDSYFEKYQIDGQHVVKKPSRKDIELCHYQGKLRGVIKSWAAISTCNGLSGMLFDGKEVHYIEPGSSIQSEDETSNGTHFLYRHSDIITNQTCGYSGTPQHILENKNHRFKREAEIIRGPYNANRKSRYVELVLVVDNKGYKELGSNLAAVSLHCKKIVNIVNAIYAPLNIFIALIGVVVWTEGDEIYLNSNGDVTLTNFLKYRRTKLIEEHPNDNAQLLTFQGRSVSPVEWSSCSLEYLLLAFDHGMDYCLRNKPTSLFDGPVCGNGFVETGEECDCGLKDSCNNPCCDADTCTLYSNATCATGECCDLQTCQIKAAGNECRSADHECDLAEFCTGQSEYCPDDVYKMDGEVCGQEKAFCYEGSCRTHSDQCCLLWGPSAKNSKLDCYQLNTKGNRHGNCGYNKLSHDYLRCNAEDIYCGRLHCLHLNERLEFGMESVSILSQSFINSKGNIIACRTATIDLGISDTDPGLVPNGAKCGDKKMCVNQHCVDADFLRMSYPSCAQNCSGNGVCNNLGHCHCKSGFAPPLCDKPGTGGSEDSGPVPNLIGEENEDSIHHDSTTERGHGDEESQNTGESGRLNGDKIRKVLDQDWRSAVQDFRSDIEDAVKKLLDKMEHKLLAALEYDSEVN
ncbi:disintegrin and metalloproteinase domain-containing protein 12 isoform X2 [Anabrus simplex]|uniref:disintegrin and metalloproteinase domain-containing protein 12 isoform X2 n=1 Tax=Anabrus simplex TaxID=316456 RepID=UPI0035A301D9